jgi:3-oxoacyl-[acyl-carrier protein] reductase
MLSQPVGPAGVGVVTGAASGIGRAVAVELASRGYRVVVAGLEVDGLEATAALVRGHGQDCRVVEVDVAEADGFAAVASAGRDLGGVSVLINNAATYPTGKWDQISEAEWDRVLAVNLKGSFLGCRAVSDQLRENGGSIVNITSNTFFRGWEGFLHYVSSKGGLVGFTRALARELGPEGVRVNAVAPGAIPTRGELIHSDREAFSAWVLENQSLKRRGTVEDIAKVVAFLSGPDSSFMTGQTLLVDGGWCMH